MMDLFSANYTLLECIALFVIAIVVFGGIEFFIKKFKALEKPKARKLMTSREQQLYLLLRIAFPKLSIFSQVSFSALITAKSYAVRATFNRKYTDFVICDDDMNVLAIIELDDSSHIGREKQDMERDKMLKQAGYRVIRYKDLPDVKAIRSDIYR